MNIWNIYLSKGLRPILSSIKPINDKGRQSNGIKKFEKRQIIDPDKAKINPPPVGVGFKWELLLFGLSNVYLLKIGNNFPIKRNEVKKQTIARNIIL